jgi:hypothetical protein
MTEACESYFENSTDQQKAARMEWKMRAKSGTSSELLMVVDDHA